MRWKKAEAEQEAGISPFQADVLRLYNQARSARAAQAQQVEDWMVSVSDDGQLTIWRDKASPAKRSEYARAAQACAEVLGWGEKNYELIWQGSRLRALLMQGVLI